MPFYHLGQVDQCRNVDYVIIADGMTQCLLCGTGWMTLDARQRHFNGSKHSMVYRRVKQQQSLDKERKDRFTFAETLQLRVDSIEHLSWRYYVKSCLHDYVVGNLIPATDVTALLNKYELMEMASLLELALIKQKVCNGVAFSSMEEMRDYRALEDGFDPETYFNEVKVTCGADVIIPLVLKFL